MKTDFWSTLAVICVAATQIIPLSTPYFLCIVFVAILSLFYSAPTRQLKVVVGLCGLLVIVTIMLGWTSPEKILAILIVLIAPLFFNRISLIIAIVIALNNLGLIGAISSLFPNLLRISLNPVIAPPIMLIFLLLITIPQRFLFWLGAASISFIGLLLIGKYDISTNVVQTIVALPVLISIWWVMNITTNTYRKVEYAIVALATISLFVWVQDLPRLPKNTVILLPESVESYESGLFKHSSQVINFAGLPTKKVVFSELTDLPENTLVVIPYLSESLVPSGEWAYFRKLAHEKRWIVMAFAEHTNYGNNADWLNYLTEGLFVNDDTTVPPGNIDYVGHVRNSSLIPLLHNSLLNRGASLSVFSPFSHILLSGDGWFADSPHHHSSKSGLGDFRLEPHEKRGRIILAASLHDGARWIFISDNSLIIDNILICNPKPFFWFVGQASLWPSFLCDLALIVVIFIALFISKRDKQKYSMLSLLGGVLVVVLFVLVSNLLLPTPSNAWRDTFINQSCFDERNFNKSLVQYISSPNANGFRLIRHKNGFDISKIGSTNGPEIHFGIIKKEGKIDNVELSNCRRLGKIGLTNNVRLMDAQACKIEGYADILLGSRDSAASFKFEKNGHPIVVILDEAFLANKAYSTGNLQWLLTYINSL